MLTMADVTVTLRVDKNIHNQMKLHDEVNWSAVLRKSIIKKLEGLERIDVARAKQAVKSMDAIRKAKIFDKGKSSVEVIREWRRKRK